MSDDADIPETPEDRPLRRGWTNLLFSLVHLRAERGDLVGAIQALDRLRADDPTDETAVQQLMLLLMRLNRRGEALQVYRQHALMLRREEESEPLPETRALYRDLRQGHMPASYVTGVAPRDGLPFPSVPHERMRDTDATAHSKDIRAGFTKCFGSLSKKFFDDLNKDRWFAVFSQIVFVGDVADNGGYFAHPRS